jgi:hypothetical protein
MTRGGGVCSSWSFEGQAGALIAPMGRFRCESGAIQDKLPVTVTTFLNPMKSECRTNYGKVRQKTESTFTLLSLVIGKAAPLRVSAPHFLYAHGWTAGRQDTAPRVVCLPDRTLESDSGWPEGSCGCSSEGYSGDYISEASKDCYGYAIVGYC